jgi:hypothetical protein
VEKISLVRTIRILTLALAALLQTVPVLASGIRYEAVDLTDTTPGGDRWLYRFTPEHDFNAGEGFTIYFAPQFYSGLTNALPTSNPDWSPALVVQPDLLSTLDGFYDVLAAVVHASTAGPFQVEFTWLGLGTPGPQPFEIYTTNAPGGFDILTAGSTSAASAVPEPATLLAAGTALLAIGALRRRR